MDAPETLCPGFRQVESFGPDEGYEDEEEVFYVTLDMGNVEPTLVPSSTSYRLIGLDTPTPFIQLQGTILKGRHDLLLGTEMIFTDDKESHNWNTRSVVHVANTEQRVAFQEVTLIPKIPSHGNGETNEINVNMEPSQEDRSAQIDRMTGLAGPPPRAPRTRKAAATSGRSTMKSKVKDTGGTSSYATRSSKGKEKETPQSLDNMLTMDDIHDDSMDDMYVDE